MENIWYQILYGFSFTLLFMFFILLSKIINDYLTPYSIDEELVQKDNTALSVSMCGYLGAMSAIFIGALLGPSQGLWQDMLSVGGYSLLGIFLLNIARIINDKCVLYKFSNTKEIIQDRNIGTGAVQCGAYLASGLIIAGAINGQNGNIFTALAFFLLGQAAFIIFTKFYNLFTPYDIHEEIEKDNAAAGVSFAGAITALGIVIMKGVYGDFISWKVNLTKFGLSVVLIFVLIPVIRIFFDKMIIPKSSLNHEIQKDQNIGAALLESVMMIGFSIMLISL